ncbi:MAG: hypothetical protein J6B75_09230 [Ruminococcus sp.]|nr:hypothetical protein [Ruminococcus sp.]
MKKVIKILIFFVLVITSVFLFLFWLFHEREYHVKTEFGDSFTLCGGGLTNEYCILDDNSDFMAVLIEFHGVNDLKAICDSDYFRCYRILNEKEDEYILKIKKYDSFFTVSESDKEYTEYKFSGRQGKLVKSEFLCDSNLMEIVLPYLDQEYHDEVVIVAKKMVSKDFVGLEKYGLTKEMIEDTETLNEKIAIMEKYSR